jgi:cell wall assembly regulator SMI1
MVAHLVERMDKWLATNRADYYSKLQPGTSNQALDGFEAKFNLRLPPDFRELYQWRNGQSGYASLQHNRMFMPLEGIASIKETLDGMIGTDFDAPEWWRQGWVPFLENGGGDLLCVDLSAEDGGAPGQLRAFWHADKDRPVEYPGLEAWLTALLESMENGSLKAF